MDKGAGASKPFCTRLNSSYFLPLVHFDSQNEIWSAEVGHGV